VVKGERCLVHLTKKLAEKWPFILLSGHQVALSALRPRTLERVEILRECGWRVYVIVGINLLREGLTCPK
jgi:excinuclease UvrABC helicase subunit UvrB